jgi:DNA-binding transcriptional MerR regulator
MYTISKLYREHNLSRSTLLYYDSIGLLKPSGRTDSNYRKYSEDDRLRLGKICAFREAGVSLEQIRLLLDTDEENENKVLERRLKEINQEIRYLRLQQRVIVEMLKVKNADDRNVLLDMELFASLFNSAGLDAEMMKKFHTVFEKNMPDSHQSFLEFLGISAVEIERIRECSRNSE